jgi:hypothetical protein
MKQKQGGELAVARFRMRKRSAVSIVWRTTGCLLVDALKLLSVSNLSSGRHWELNQVPAV